MKKIEFNSIKTSKLFVTIDGKDVEVTEEVYREYKRPLWREHKRKERERKCSLGVHRCTMQCNTCPRNKEGAPLSLDTMLEDGLEIASSASVEDEVYRHLKYEASCKAIDELPPTDREIFIGFINKVPERDIAKKVHKPQTTVSYRAKIIQKQLREKLKDWD